MDRVAGGILIFVLSLPVAAAHGQGRAIGDKSPGKKRSRRAATAVQRLASTVSFESATRTRRILPQISLEQPMTV